MDRPEHKQAQFFIGQEVEHTPAHGMDTLFVIGLQETKTILKHARTNKCQHIYFGANQSFPNPKLHDAEIWYAWEAMIQTCLDKGYTCTLDIDVSSAEGLLESGLTERDNFIPMISVKLPYLRQLGYNATIKLDDRDFKSTNPGVWCHMLHDLMDRNKFTNWNEYSHDKVLK